MPGGDHSDSAFSHAGLRCFTIIGEWAILPLLACLEMSGLNSMPVVGLTPENRVLVICAEISGDVMDRRFLMSAG